MTPIMQAAAASECMPCDPTAALEAALGRIVQVLAPSQQDWDKRRRLVNEHIARLAKQLNSPHPIQIATFGSSLSGLCLSSSDLDLGLFGRMDGCPLDRLRSKQQRSLLAQVMTSLKAAHLAQGKKVQAIWGARVPVLKYTCTLSGLDCDISIQGTGALLKASFMHILSIYCQQLAPLYRLVKLWAQAHDLNDASRGTLNSTSLLYMTIFYLQQSHLLPPLQELVPLELLPLPHARLLQGCNQQAWDDPQRLRHLLAAVQGRMAAWVAGQQQQQQKPAIGLLLSGFFQMWSGQLSNWVLGKNRDLHADLWHGTLRPGVFPKKYIFSLQDPFDASDCPARAVGSNTNTKGGTAAFIAYMFSSSSKVMQRYMENCQTQSSIGSMVSADGVGGAVGWFEEWEESYGSAAAAGEVPLARIELCKVLAWLFGPQGLLLLGCDEQQRRLTQGDMAWAFAPFPQGLVAAVQQRQQQKMKPASLLTWLVEQLEAQLSQEQNILTLQHMDLLTKQTSQTATAAGRSRTSVSGVHRQQQLGTQDKEQRHPQQQSPLVLISADNSEANDGCVLDTEKAEHTASSQQDHVSVQQQQLVSRAATNSNSISSIPMQGPALDVLDVMISQEQQHLSHRLDEFRACHQHLRPQTSPKRYPKAVKKTVQRSLTAVAERLLQLQQQQVESVTVYGFLAVLQQHGFSELLERYGFIDDGVLWHQVIPEGMAASQAAAATAVANMRELPVMLTEGGGNSSEAAEALAISGTQDASDSSSSSGQPPSLRQFLGSGGNACALLKKLYSFVRVANKLRLEAASAAGYDMNSPVLQQATVAASVKTPPKFDTTTSKGAEGQQQHTAVVHLPALSFLSSGADGELVLKQLVSPDTTYQQVIKTGSAAAADKHLSAKIVARRALNWLGSQADVVLAVEEAVQTLQDQRRHQQDVGKSALQGVTEQQQQQPANRQQHQANSSGTAMQQSCSVTTDQKQAHVCVPSVSQQHGSASQPAGSAAAMAGTAPVAVARSRHKPAGRGSSSNSANSLLAPASLQVQQQQQSGRHPKADTGVPADLVDALTSMSLGEGVNHRNEVQEILAGTGTTDKASKSRAARTALRNLRRVQEQIQHLEQRIEQKQRQLQEDEQELTALLHEQQQILAAAGSSDSAIMRASTTEAAESDGNLLLQLAMQQSVQLASKTLKNNINNLKSRVKSNKQAMQRFETSMHELKQQEADADAALQSTQAAPVETARCSQQ